MRGRLVGAMGATSSVVGFGFGCEMCERDQEGTYVQYMSNLLTPFYYKELYEETILYAIDLR